jgi:L-threonylcarbamoyladenylate synthase
MKEINILKNKLLNDFVILFPTDTVYALLANAYSKRAMENVFEIKQRPKEKTFAIFADRKKLEKYVELNERNSNLFKKFTPGPVTFVLKNKDQKLSHLEIDEKIGIRIPDNEFLQELLKTIDFPLIATSANISGEKTAIFYEDVNGAIKNHPFVHDFNYESLLDKKPSGISSSIFDISEDEIKILRDGIIKLTDISN